MKKVTRVKYGKERAQEWCTRVHKSITGRPLTDRYTLVDLEVVFTEHFLSKL